MPEVDLSKKIPGNATWLKLHYEMKPLKEGANLIARVWSGNLDEAVVIKGNSGEAFIKLNKPQMISYQRPVNIELSMKVMAFKTGEEKE
ncbi:MAG: hypothetical protein ACKVQC_11150 [Elusimicrobiota bacterium]